LVQEKENSGILTVAFKASHFCSEGSKTGLSYFRLSKFHGLHKRNKKDKYADT